MDLFKFDTNSAITDRFEFQLRPLVEIVRHYVENQVFSNDGDSSVGEILQAAPAEACLQLADAISTADVMGVDSEELLSRFDPIERFVIEMVTGVYANSRCNLFSEPMPSILDGSGRMLAMA